MQFSTKTQAPERVRTGCVIVPVCGGRLTPAGEAIDAASGQALSRVLASGDLPAKPGSALLVHLDGPAARALLVAGGEDAEPSDKHFRTMVRTGLREARKLAAPEVLSLLQGVAVGDRSLAWKLHVVVAIARELDYRFDRYKSKKEDEAPGLRNLNFSVAQSEVAEADAAIAEAVAIAEGVDLAKDLGNCPPNVCSPAYLADAARKMARSQKIKVEVLDVKAMQELKMGSLLAVGQGSAQPPRFVVLQYQGGGARQAPVVLVGKGITFDTGGISIKPAAEMDEMKFDMGGAASVLGVFRALAELQPAVNVVGLIPACENMPDGRAVKPGDVVTSLSGQTIEILNTDAEGRLVLCDALTYAERLKPRAVIDIATLTGACVIALGGVRSGLFSPDDALADALLAAGDRALDLCWRLPLDADYAEALKTHFADVANVGGRPAGAVTAAKFLQRFATEYPWAHLDIAGTAWKGGAAKGATGRPVGLLVQYLLAQAGPDTAKPSGKAKSAKKAKSTKARRA